MNTKNKMQKSKKISRKSEKEKKEPKTKTPHEKDVIKVLSGKFEVLGVKKGEEGELFLVDKKEKKAFAIFFDKAGFCRCGITLKFKDFVITKPYDEASEYLNLFG